MRDVLKLMYSKEISPEEAEELFHDVMDRIHRKKEKIIWAEEIGLSKYEATAFAQGASLSDLVKLRYEGWPRYCSRCKKGIDYKQFGWWFIRDDNGSPRLEHLQCPSG